MSSLSGRPDENGGSRPSANLGSEWVETVLLGNGYCWQLDYKLEELVIHRERSRGSRRKSNNILQRTEKGREEG